MDQQDQRPGTGKPWWFRGSRDPCGGAGRAGMRQGKVLGVQLARCVKEGRGWISRPLVPANVISFGDRGLCGCDPGKRRPHWIGTIPNPRPWVLMGRGEFGCRYIRRGPCEDGGGDQSDVSTNQGMARIARSCQKPGEMHGTGSSPELQREHGPLMP